VDRQAAQDAELGPIKRYLSWTNILFIGLWLLFLWCLFQVPHMQGQKMATFDPYEILNLEKGATLPEIKRAYRTLSLEFHPDKHPNDEEVRV
jgi:translocation protein SEC63